MSTVRIRPRILSQMRAVIEKRNFFAPNDFEVTEHKHYTFAWRYMPQPDMIFAANVPEKKTGSTYEVDYQFEGIFIPGEVHVQEKFSATGLKNFLETFSTWLTLLQEDLEASPLRRSIEAQRHQIDELMHRVEEMEDAYFSNEEIAELRERLEQQEKKLVEKIRAASSNNTKQNQELQERLTRLEQEFAAMKSQLHMLKKKQWWRSVFGRVIEWTTNPKNQHLLEAGANVVGNLLGPKQQ